MPPGLTMPSTNAFLDPPRLPASSKYRFHSRADSRSPTRQHARDLDPLLRDLSPSATLRAFVSDPTELSGDDALTNSIRASSMGERALGAKAAQAGLDLRTWTREIEGWEWSGTFDVPEPVKKKVRLSIIDSALQEHTIAPASTDEEEEYWGSLPARIVQSYERRADEIGQQLDEMDVEELKEYVLATHYRVDTRPSSREDSMSTISATSDLKRLDDFTALVTATILQALPYLSKLNRLLDLWTIRLLVLRNAPKFLRELKRAKTEMDHGWETLAVAPLSDSAQGRTDFDRRAMLEMKIVIERQVGTLGRKLDRFLDDLEGREDTVPDTWIDDFEHLESAYGSWVVQAERKVLEVEWQQAKASAELEKAKLEKAELAKAELEKAALPSQSAEGGADVVSELEIPSLDSDAVVQPFMDRTGDVQSQKIARAIKMSPEEKNIIAGTSLRSRITPTPIPANANEEKERHESILVSPRMSRDGAPSPGLGAPEEPVQGRLAKKRAAFLNDIERTNSLKQSKSHHTVRPFEHASNAFTRLFKKDRTPEHSRLKKSSIGMIDPVDSPNVPDYGGEHRAISTASSASFRFNAASSPILATSASSSRQSSRHVAPGVESEDTGTVETKHEDLQEREVTVPDTSDFVLDQDDTKLAVYEMPLPDINKSTELSSPFHSPSKPELPEDWPLTAPAASRQSLDQTSETEGKASFEKGDDKDELVTVDAPIQTDAFDRMFLQSLDNPPAVRPGSARTSPMAEPWTGDEQRRASLSQMMRHLSTDTSRQKTPSQYSNVTPRAISPSPKIQSGDHQDTRAPLDMNHIMNELSGHNTDSSYMHMQNFTPDSKHDRLNYSENSEADGEDSNNENARPSAIKRASFTSIELFSRAQLKSIDVPRSSRQSSVSSRATPPQTPSLSPDPPMSLLSEEHPENHHMNYKGTVAFPTPPRHGSLTGTSKPFRRGSTPSVREVGAGGITEDMQDSPVGVSASPGNAPLNITMKKRREQSGLRNENQSSGKLTVSPSKRSAPLETGDNFDRHVSDVLDTLPNDIRFKTRPGAETPAPRISDARNHFSAPRSKTPQSRRASKSGSMTIAPAESSPRKSSSKSDPEVKLYHLTQAGREDPIKLFVRLVGEGERVMVRVGGGWADLSDYLRQYAEHHGSRTVSEGGLEVQTMPNALTRKVSGPAESIRAKTPVTPRPDSSDSDKDWPLPASNRGTFRLENNGRDTPTSQRGGRQTPNGSTPKSSSGSSRPSTANASRPPSRQNTGEVGLAGPSSGKKSGLSEHKAKWVEGMIERAKQASAEKTREDQKYFGELGKAGGTRRVIFRSTSEKHK